jgi:hypothetical protein
MKVKTITAHGNPCGSAFWKDVGAVYELSDAEAPALIAAGLVEECAGEDAAEDAGEAPAGTVSRGAKPRKD